MSDADRRLRVIAIAFAGAALLIALVAVVVVVRRESPTAPTQKTSEKTPEKPAVVVGTLTDRKVLASDVVKLQRGTIELAIDGGVPIGIRVKDTALAAALGLEADDVITSLSGRPLKRELDVYDAVFNMAMMNATTVYVELQHGSAPMLLRWQLDGDLRKARYAANGSALASLTGPPPPPAPPDPMLDTIEMVDDTHVNLPKKTLEHLLANPMAAMKSTRVVPSVRSGQPDGFKLYAILPYSAPAKLGFQNGDTLQTINGTALTSPDKALEVYTSLRDAKKVEIDLQRRGKPVHLTITITK